MEAKNGANGEERTLDFLDVYVYRGWYLNVNVNIKTSFYSLQVAKKSVNIGFNWLLVYVPVHIFTCTAASQQHHIEYFITELILQIICSY